jgi:2-amino-4-hydroxy-6-hydroxymethyldihydropteridine diphosphokinase
MKESICFISLGSNIGNTKKHLDDAVSEILKLPDTSLVKTSSYMLTSPVGVSEQPDFLNRICVLKTGISPLTLLRHFKEIEKKLGRVTRGHWKEREIDIDIIFYNHEIFNTEELIIPHKEFARRYFVLAGCAELFPAFSPYNDSKNILDFLKDLQKTEHNQSVRLVNNC